MTVRSPKNRRRMFRLLRAIVYSSIALFLCWQVWHVRHGLAASISSVGWTAVGFATGFTVIANFPGFFGWRLLVTGAGVRLTLSDAAWLFFAAAVTRYLPGAIWPTVAQAALARRVGAPATKLMATGLVAVVLTALSGGIVGLLAFPRLVADDPKWWLMLPVLLSAGAVMLAPRLLRRLLGLGQRILRHEEHGIAMPSPRTSMGMIAFSILGWCCSGMHAAIIAMALGAPPISAITLGVGGFTLSAVAGAVSLTPAGIGVREVVLGLTLGILISGPNLVTLLLLSRVLTILGHVIATLGVLGLLAGNRHMKRRRDKEKWGYSIGAPNER
ncbi:lysylphosphatidylglycerol synthase transmembrane domain-containing protein [Streptomyces sp. DG1A-41]|uniref:lysylphosphatidylglycerol synthase transmembrane domain-containing protein n=1 Tax=Streptomyces sp. DG1A-41 TaxID=3125779 RepID=UPI0030CC4E2B